ncbi:MAG: DUF2304 domain-containing protein [Eubacteriales bacterium]|nr:DUF2304 domain-containing protein [Eubacteriales bacterium]MDD4327574.1 DUF2304 domain-containing protein [Eubacteriales bacterium]
MERVLQVILLIGTTLFSVYIINMVRTKRIELKYTLVWLLTCLAFFVLALFPKLIDSIAALLSVKDSVNALFLVIIFFMLMILFSLTASASIQSNSIKELVQEIGILRNRIDELEAPGDPGKKED